MFYHLDLQKMTSLLEQLNKVTLTMASRLVKLNYHYGFLSLYLALFKMLLLLIESFFLYPRMSLTATYSVHQIKLIYFLAIYISQHIK